MTLQILAILLLGLMCGSELNVAAFAHPVLNRQPSEAHILVRSSLAKLFGRVMPFWMAGSTLLNLSLLLPFEHLNKSAWHLAATAARCHADLFRCSKGSSSERFSRVEPAIQKGITRPNNFASDERTSMCASDGCRLSTG